MHAVVVLTPAPSSTAEALLDALPRGASPASRCRASIDLRDEPLPKSGAGKMLKTQLREPFWHGRERRVS